MAAGTPEFTERSIRLYGRPDDVYETQSFTGVDAAAFLLEKTDRLLSGSSIAQTETDQPAKQFAERLQKAIDALFRGRPRQGRGRRQAIFEGDRRDDSNSYPRLGGIYGSRLRPALPSRGPGTYRNSHQWSPADEAEEPQPGRAVHHPHPGGPCSLCGDRDAIDRHQSSAPRGLADSSAQAGIRRGRLHRMFQVPPRSRTSRGASL